MRKIKPFVTCAENKKRDNRGCPHVEYKNWTQEMHRVNAECNALRFAEGKPPRNATRYSKEDIEFRMRFLCNINPLSNLPLVF